MALPLSHLACIRARSSRLWRCRAFHGILPDLYRYGGTVMCPSWRAAQLWLVTFPDRTTQPGFLGSSSAESPVRPPVSSRAAATPLLRLVRSYPIVLWLRALR